MATRKFLNHAGPGHGGAGFIGSAVCRHFIRDLGHEVVVVDKLTYAGNLASLAPFESDPRYPLKDWISAMPRASGRLF